MSDQSHWWAQARYPLPAGKMGAILCCILGQVLRPELQPSKVCWFDCGNPVLPTLFLDFMVNHKLTLQPANARKGILVFFSFLTLAVLPILEIYWKEENSFLKRFLPLAWASVSPEGRWLTASQAVIRTGFPNLFALLFCFLLPL